MAFILPWGAPARPPFYVDRRPRGAKWRRHFCERIMVVEQERALAFGVMVSPTVKSPRPESSLRLRRPFA